MFDPAIFDTGIFDTPAPFHFGRSGRKFERGLYNSIEQNIAVVGEPIRMHHLALSVRGEPFGRLSEPISVSGAPYRTFNKEIAISRKRGFKMLLEMLEGD